MLKLSKWKEIQSLRSLKIICFACSLQERVASFYVESNSIFCNFLAPLLKTCIRIKWIVWNMKTCEQKNKNTKIPPYEKSCLLKVLQEKWFHQIFDGKYWTFLLLLTSIVGIYDRSSLSMYTRVWSSRNKTKMLNNKIILFLLSKKWTKA